MSKFFDDTMQGLLEAVAMEYKSMKESKDKSIEDCLTIGVDFFHNDRGVLVVMRRKGDEIHVLNEFSDDEALGLYNKLIGNKKNQAIKVTEDFVETKHQNTTTNALERYEKHHKG